MGSAAKERASHMKTEHDLRLDAYSGSMERWKIELALNRIRAWGFPKHEWDDLLQGMVIHMAAFRYDPAKSNGAKESTVLYALVNHQLAQAARAKNRRATFLERYKAALGAVDGAGEEALSYRENVALQMDVREAVNALPARERFVCRELLHGEQPVGIARKLGCHPETVRRCIRRIRTSFDALGLREWIQGSETGNPHDGVIPEREVRN